MRRKRQRIDAFCIGAVGESRGTTSWAFVGGQERAARPGGEHHANRRFGTAPKSCRVGS